MKKPYFVELRVTAVVMADSEIDAMVIADLESREIVSDNDLEADCAVLLNGLDELQRFDGNWDGDCIPYGDDGNTRLKDILPETAPVKDTKTIDMFS